MKNKFLIACLLLSSNAAFANNYYCHLQSSGKTSELLSFNISKKASNAGPALVTEFNQTLNAHAYFEQSEDDASMDFVSVFLIPNTQKKVLNTGENHIAVSFSQGTKKVSSAIRLDGVSYGLSCTKI